jgi:hypothetical protein
MTTIKINSNDLKTPSAASFNTNAAAYTAGGYEYRKYTLGSTTLLAINSQGDTSNTIYVKNWQSGQLGINLTGQEQDAEKPQSSPILVTSLAGNEVNFAEYGLTLKLDTDSNTSNQSVTCNFGKAKSYGIYMENTFHCGENLKTNQSQSAICKSPNLIAVRAIFIRRNHRNCLIKRYLTAYLNPQCSGVKNA